MAASVRPLAVEGDLVLSFRGRTIPIRAVDDRVSVELGTLAAGFRLLRSLRRSRLPDFVTKGEWFGSTRLSILFEVRGHRVAELGERRGRLGAAKLNFPGLVRALFTRGRNVPR